MIECFFFLNDIPDYCYCSIHGKCFESPLFFSFEFDHIWAQGLLGRLSRLTKSINTDTKNHVTITQQNSLHYSKPSSRFPHPQISLLSDVKLLYKKILREMLMQLYCGTLIFHSINGFYTCFWSYTEMLPICTCFWIGLNHNWSFFCKALPDGED